MDSQDKIPKIIHYCWFGDKQLPTTVVNCQKTWKKNNPNYKIIRWDETNSPMSHPFVKSAYKSGKFAFVSDYVRLWAVYNFGGIYLDTDMYVIKNLDFFLNDKCFFGYENKEESLINAAAFGAVEKNKFIGVLMTYYENKIFTNSKLSSFVIPKIITKLYNENNLNNIKLYNHDFFYPFPYEDRDNPSFLDYVTLNTYAIHLWDLSWFNKKDAHKQRIFSYINKFKSLFK